MAGIFISAHGTRFVDTVPTGALDDLGAELVGLTVPVLRASIRACLFAFSRSRARRAPAGTENSGSPSGIQIFLMQRQFPPFRVEGDRTSGDIGPVPLRDPCAGIWTVQERFFFRRSIPGRSPDIGKGARGVVVAASRKCASALPSRPGAAPWRGGAAVGAAYVHISRRQRTAISAVSARPASDPSVIAGAKPRASMRKP